MANTEELVAAAAADARERGRRDAPGRLAAPVRPARRRRGLRALGRLAPVAGLRRGAVLRGLRDEGRGAPRGARRGLSRRLAGARRRAGAALGGGPGGLRARGTAPRRRGDLQRLLRAHRRPRAAGALRARQRRAGAAREGALPARPALSRRPDQRRPRLRRQRARRRPAADGAHRLPAARRRHAAGVEPARGFRAGSAARVNPSPTSDQSQRAGFRPTAEPATGRTAAGRL